MKSISLIPRTLVLVFAYSLIHLNVQSETANRRAAVEKANDQFYVALNAMFTGNLKPMNAIWSHADDVTYLGPDGGFDVGWKSVLKNWEKQAALKLGGKVTQTDVVINVGQDIAVVHNFEKGENTDKEGNIAKVSIRATNIFRLEEGHWKMIGHHTDLLPFIE